MKIRSLMLAGAVFPFAFSPVAFSAEPLVLAQAEAECPEGAECPPAEETQPEQSGAEEAAPEGNRRDRALERAQRRQERLRERQGEEQQGEDAAAEPAPPEEPPAETAEQPPAEAPPAEAAEQAPAEPPPADAAEQQPEQPPAEDTATEPPAEESPAQATSEEPAPESPPIEAAEPAAEPEQPVAEQPAEAAPAEAEQQAEQPAEQASPAAEADDSTVEEQLEAQGDDEQAEQVRKLRRQLREQRREAEAAEEAAEEDQAAEPAEEAETAGDDQAREGEGNRRRDRGEVVERRGDRVIIREGDQIFVEPADRDDIDRLLFGARDVEVERLRNGRTRTTVFRENGSQIVTVRNRDGDIVRRTRITRDGREIVLIDNRERRRDDQRPIVIVPPPRIVGIPQDRYIVELGRASPQVLEEALLAPPVQEIERGYTLDEVVRSEPLRAYVPRIDLDTVTFEFGSATIGNDQVPAIIELGEAMEDVIAEHPDEVYLIEGHTDAVGSDYDNLILSDRRAEAVAVALSQNFDIPPENLVTEGYGEQYLKVVTSEPERANRRVTVRRITPLLAAADE